MDNKNYRFSGFLRMSIGLFVIAPTIKICKFYEQENIYNLSEALIWLALTAALSKFLKKIRSVLKFHLKF